MATPLTGRAVIPKLKEYKYLYSSNSFLFEAIGHLTCISSYHGLAAEVQNGLVCVLSLLVGVFELLERRRQSLPLLTAENAELIDIALEGASNQGPRPSVPELQSVFDKLTDLRIKQAKETAKATSSGSNRGRGNRSRGGGRTGSGARHSGSEGKGKDPIR